MTNRTKKTQIKKEIHYVILKSSATNIYGRDFWLMSLIVSTIMNGVCEM
jgi:hypothetical protein